MKKYLMSTLAVFTVLTITTAASAQTTYYDDGYVKVDAGYSMGSGRTENAALFGIGTGFRMNDYFKADVTAEFRPWGKEQFRNAGGLKGDMWTADLMANAYASYPVWDKFSVYATGGVGYAYTKVKNFAGQYKGEAKSNFAWNVGAGVEYALTSNICLDLGYRYTDLGTAEAKDRATGAKHKEDVKYNDIKLGMQYYF